jgi:putative PIN family toxin of toxin-antitoxin system
MPHADRIVIDTNVLVSAIAWLNSVPARGVEKALDQDIVLFSETTMAELSEVLSRPKFDRYVSPQERQLFLEQMEAAAEFVPIIQLVRTCRDPNDDKFLEVALNGRADAIITGDADLLALHPWREIAVLSPADYLQS